MFTLVRMNSVVGVWVFVCLETWVTWVTWVTLGDFGDQQVFLHLFFIIYHRLKK
jgi:hypothetical protein